MMNKNINEIKLYYCYRMASTFPHNSCQLARKDTSAASFRGNAWKKNMDNFSFMMKCSFTVHGNRFFFSQQNPRFQGSIFPSPVFGLEAAESRREPGANILPGANVTEPLMLDNLS